MDRFARARGGIGPEDMGEVEYRNTLALASLITLLVDKGILRRGELAGKAEELDMLAAAEAVSQRRRSR